MKLKMSEALALNLYLTLQYLKIGVIYFWNFILSWWWIFLPFILLSNFKFFWRWWRVEYYFKNNYHPILLEIKIPQIINKPIRAMESVMASLHGAFYKPPDWSEYWIDGEFQPTISFEIASIEGHIHLYVRIQKEYRNALEAAFYSQYPEVEIIEAEDYTKKIPQDIPNNEWKIFGADYKFNQANPYPIKTYLQFETEQEKTPEQIIDPVSHLFEGLAKIGKGEQLWVQLIARPTSAGDKIFDPGGYKFLQEAKNLRDKLAKRGEEKSTTKMKPLAQETFEAFFEALVEGKSHEITMKTEKKEESVIPPEMRLTPGEKEIVESVERKMSKPWFNCNLRFILLGKKDAFFKPNFRLFFNFMNAFTTFNMNALYPWTLSLTKIHKGFDYFLFPFIAKPIYERRMYLRGRRLFRDYVERNSPLFPHEIGEKAMFILSTEELASIFHFPGWGTSPVPGVMRVDAKKSPPPDLPI